MSISEHKFCLEIDKISRFQITPCVKSHTNHGVFLPVYCGQFVVTTRKFSIKNINSSKRANRFEDRTNKL